MRIAQVSPYPWDGGHEVNTYVAALSDELAARGHRVAVLAPSGDEGHVRSSRRLIREASAEAPLGTEGSAQVLAVGEVLPLATAGRRSLPLDVGRAVERVLAEVPFDVVHVHEPFAPSTASVALRHSHALNVGSFHAPTERVLSTQLARRVVELFFGRLDARTATYAATRELMRRFFPAEYRVIGPGAPAPLERPAAGGGPVRLLYVGAEERPALRLFLRALRRLPPELDWHATVRARGGGPPATQLRRELRERVTVLSPDRAPAEAELLAEADVLVCASDGAGPAPGLLVRALAAGAVPLAARLASYEEVLGEGERGLLFEPGSADELAAQLGRLVGDAELRARLRDQAGAVRDRLTWARVADEFEDVYAGLLGRRHAVGGRPEVRSRLAGRRTIDVDLHMHTDHSHDCATPVEVLLDTARAQGLGAIAVTDHNEVSGALEAQEKAARYGVKVIVGEEVKTATQGEVIGLFLQEKIPRGLSLEETIAEIRRQGGLVYVPHPFDRLHAVPDYEHLLAVLDDVDAIEVFNPRVAISSFNEEAVRFAAKYRVVAGAGSDAHVAQGLGSVRIRMRDFDGPDEFLESLREADIVRSPASLVYVQALKFLQTRATPAPARKAVRARRVRRATRKS